MALSKVCKLLIWSKVKLFECLPHYFLRFGAQACNKEIRIISKMPFLKPGKITEQSVQPKLRFVSTFGCLGQCKSPMSRDSGFLSAWNCLSKKRMLLMHIPALPSIYSCRFQFSLQFGINFRKENTSLFEYSRTFTWPSPMFSSF